MKDHRMIGMVGVVALSLMFQTPVQAQTREAELEGFQEVPVISTTGEGECRVNVNNDHTVIQAKISYSNLEGAVTQAHIHLGQQGVNGGIVLFFCSNLPSKPAGTPTCVAAPSTMQRTFTATDVQEVTDQGIDAGEIEELIEAIRKGKAYCNVHSTTFPTGEIRGQLKK